MDGSKEQKHDNPEEGDTDVLQARTKLNEYVMTAFKRCLAADPSADLFPLFQRYAASYPGRRARCNQKKVQLQLHVRYV